MYKKGWYLKHNGNDIYGWVWYRGSMEYDVDANILWPNDPNRDYAGYWTVDPDYMIDLDFITDDFERGLIDIVFSKAFVAKPINPILFLDNIDSVLRIER